VLVLLPPSESKESGGDGPPVDLEALSFPSLTPVRRKVAEALVDLAGDVPASLRVLGLSPRQVDEVARNAGLWSAPTLPALARYTGVLYDALGFAAFTRPQRAKANRRLAVASALFGIVRGTDRIPAYRLSGGASMPAFGSLRTVWRPALEPVLAELDELIVDLRSGAYAALARVPGAVTVRVVTVAGTTVSHHNKAYKGKLAAALATAPREPSTVEGLIGIAAKAGITLRRTSDLELSLTTSS
jgi:cytoplasmic iron level regulating protein YaaA (DUF328/UPF0246 family)